MNTIIIYICNIFHEFFIFIALKLNNGPVNLSNNKKKKNYDFEKSKKIGQY